MLHIIVQIVHALLLTGSKVQLQIVRKPDIMFFHIFQHIKSHNSRAFVILAAPGNKIAVFYCGHIGLVVPVPAFLNYIQMCPDTYTVFIFPAVIANLTYIVVIVMNRKAIFF